MNFEAISNLNIFLGTGAIIVQIISVIALFVLFFGHKTMFRKNVLLDFIDKHFLVLGLVFSLIGTLFSLVYSEIINFAPCYLCWWARVFLYPQVILFGIALWDNDRKIIKYITPLLSLGFLVVAYHNFMYYFAETGNLPCDASGVSCYQQLVYEFGGYISIPMLALTNFFALAVIIVIAHFYGKRD
jgi:disulfide bond formation protein DsbB